MGRYRLTEWGRIDTLADDLQKWVVGISVQGETPRLGGRGDQPPSSSTRTRAHGPGVETGSQRAAKARLGAG